MPTPSSTTSAATSTTTASSPPDGGEARALAVRLSGGGAPSEGRLDVEVPAGSGRWGAVCLNSFTRGVVPVVCRQLGFT